MRYFIHLSFDGTNYSGWQRQHETNNTLQEVVESTLSALLKKQIRVYGCGRTDAGVHASQYVVQLDIDRAPLFDLKFRLNKNLPSDIAVFDVFEVEDNIHCRYDAISRTYDYFLHWKKDSHLINYSSFYDGLTLDFDLMKKAAMLIENTVDFKPLCKQPDFYENTECNISNCQLFIDDERGRMRFTITSNRFLRGMIRHCIFFLLKVGSGKMTIDDFQKILNQELQLKQKQPALPNGLFLSMIKYPTINLKESSSLIKMLKIGLDK